jgi:hypothetical protein
VFECAFFINIWCGCMSCDGGVSSLRLACLLYVFVVFCGCAFSKTSRVGACLVMGACLLYV